MFGKKNNSDNAVLSRELVMDRLKTIKYPGFSRNIISFGVVKNVTIQDSTVKVQLNFTTQNAEIREQIAILVREQLETMQQVKNVELQTTAQTAQAPPQASVSHAPADRESEKLLMDTKYRIAVASGKGGVGKSTVAVNLAIALAKRGARVGLLDADIYGPNIPIMLGAYEKPKGRDNKVLPLERYGIKLMSIGFFLDENSPIIWRGPLVGKAIEQLMRDVAWEDIDFFIVDMPPGTGDAQISLSSLTKLSGSVMVSTPQNVALTDVIKGVKMFQKVDVAIIGMVENMSYFICPHCGERTDIFAHGNTEKTSRNLGVPFLGSIPLDTAIREGGDEGKPIVAMRPDSPQAESFFAIADKILEKMPL